MGVGVGVGVVSIGVQKNPKKKIEKMDTEEGGGREGEEGGGVRASFWADDGWGGGRGRGRVGVGVGVVSIGVQKTLKRK